MDQIIAKIFMTKAVLPKSRLYLKKNGIVIRIMVMIIEGIIKVTILINAMGTLSRTSLGKQILPRSNIMSFFEFVWHITPNAKHMEWLFL